MTESIELTDDDRKHIARIQELRELGTHNMFTECREGLKAHFGDEGIETYEWVLDNFEYFRTGDWKDVDISGDN